MLYVFSFYVTVNLKHYYAKSWGGMLYVFSLYVTVNRIIMQNHGVGCMLYIFSFYMTVNLKHNYAKSCKIMGWDAV